MQKCVAGIILAAGLSTRMGRPKLILEINGVPLITRIVHAALESRLKPLVLVSGSSGTDIEQALGHVLFDPKLHHVTNPRPDLGMSSSLRVGLDELAGTTAGAMVILADQPGLTAEIIERLVNVFEQDVEKIVVPTVVGRRTTPVVFPKRLFRELLQVIGDVGGREILKRYTDSVVSLELGTLYDDSDLDTPQDHQKLKQSFEQRTDQ